MDHQFDFYTSLNKMIDPSFVGKGLHFIHKKNTKSEKEINTPRIGCSMFLNASIKSYFEHELVQCNTSCSNKFVHNQGLIIH